MKYFIIIFALLYNSLLGATVRVTNASLVPLTFMVGPLGSDYLLQNSYGGVVLPNAHVDLNIPGSKNVSANRFSIWALDDDNYLNWADSYSLFQQSLHPRASFYYEFNSDVNTDQDTINDLHDYEFTIRAWGNSPSIYPYRKNDIFSIYKGVYAAGAFIVPTPAARYDYAEMASGFGVALLWWLGFIIWSFTRQVFDQADPT